MRPPTNGIQASAAATLEGRPVDCVVGLLTGGGVASGAGGGDVGSNGSATLLLDEIERLFVK